MPTQRTFASYLPYTLGIAVFAAIIGSTEKLLSSSSVIKHLSEATTAFLCSTPKQPSWFDSDIAIQTIQPVLRDNRIAIFLLALSLIVFLLNKRASVPKGKRNPLQTIRSTLISAAAVTIIIHVVLISIRILAQSEPEFQKTCIETVPDRLKPLLETSPQTAENFLQLFKFPEPKEIPKDSLPFPFVQSLYSQVYPIATFGFKNIKSYLAYGSLGLGVIHFFPFLHKAFTMIEPFTSLTGAIYLLTHYYAKTLANISSIESVTNIAQNLHFSKDNITEFILAFITFYVIVQSLITLLGFIANVSSNRLAILGTVLLWNRAHALGLPWLGSVSFEIFAVVLILVILFNTLENTAGLFLISGNISKIYPVKFPALFVEWYLVAATVYSVLTKIFSTPVQTVHVKAQPQASHQEEVKANPEHKPKQKGAEQRKRPNK